MGIDEVEFMTLAKACGTVTATTFTLTSEQKMQEIHAIAICEISNEKQLTKHIAKIIDMRSFAEVGAT